MESDRPRDDDAPDAPRDEAGPTSRGSSQSGVRLYNERLILSLIRRHARLTKVEIARMTGLSQQTTTVIINRLTGDGLLAPGEPQRGRVGQPAVPYSLNPDGAFSIGLTIGRRSAEAILMDFCAGIRDRRRINYNWPDVPEVLGFAARAALDLAGGLSGEQARRIAGLGVAMPFELWKWHDILDAPEGALDAWRDVDLARDLGALVPWPVNLCNDATAACGAELTLGAGGRFRDFVYFYVGAFVGAGIVLDGSLVPGRTGNAGALGSMPVVRRGRGGTGVRQLIRSASIYLLERRLIAAGIDARIIWQTPQDWSDLGEPLDSWIDESASALAQACVAAAAVVDFEAMIIEGNFPPDIRARLVARVRERVERIDRQGLSPFEIVEGSLGRDARTIGGAALPFLANFARDREVLFKERADAA